MSKQNKRTLFSYIFASYISLAMVLLLFFIGGFFVTDIAGELERNNYKYYYGKVEQKRAEIENAMLDRWGNERMIEQLKKIIIHHYQQGHSTMDVGLGEKLKETIGFLDVSGGLVVLNEEDFGNDSIYIRNSNNRSRSSGDGSYTIVAGDISMASKMHLALSDRWSPSFIDRNEDHFQLIQYVRKRLKEKGEPYFWYKYHMGNQDSMMLFTSVEHEGRQLGIIAIEINESVMNDYLNYIELSATKKSAYAIARKNIIYGTYYNEFINGPFVSAKLPKGELSYKKIDNVNFVTYSGTNYVAYSIDDFVAIVLPLRLGTVDFDWSIIAYIPKDEFYVHSSSIMNLVKRSIAITVIISVGLAYLISRLMTAPIRSLVKFAENNEVHKDFGIKEYDKIMDLMNKMALDIEDGTDRLDFVLRLLRTRMIILEHDLERRVINKYGLGGELLEYLYGEHGWPKASEEFGDLINGIYENVVTVSYDKDEISEYKILGIKQDFGSAYIKIVSQIENNTVYYFIMDYTNEAMIEQQLAYEEEYDRETGLLNRESFKRKLMHYLTENPDTKGAMVMWTLEDVDYVNNAYGYSAGDEYIKAAGKVLSDMGDNDIFMSRYANNKYVTFIPFEQMRDKVIAIINEYTMRITKEKVKVSRFKEIGLKICKGIAWYPSDTRDVNQLCVYAEYAYSSSGKRTINSNHQFSIQSYENYIQAISMKEYFDELVVKREVDYAFQPIVDIISRTIIGYEALMRPTSKNLLYVDDVLKMARIHSKLPDVEVLTMQEVFKRVKKSSVSLADKLIFVNTIGDIQVSKRIIGSIFGDEMDKNIVFDLSGVEKLEYERLSNKSNWVHGNDFQLCFDDFGMWYSSGRLIKNIRPEYIKLSKEIVRGIHMERDKQETLKEISKVCAMEGVKLIAVGAENIEELRYLKENGIRYVQGFIVGEPKFDIIDYLEDDVLEVLDLSA